MNVGKCFACRSCINLKEDKTCKEGKTMGADRPDECWLYHNKFEPKGLASHAPASGS